jgi:putative cardiolipin synthase
MDRLNHRMHNKSWIADNRIAVVGGRNLGDEYFGASDHVNFVDLDFVMIGPVVRDISRSFDRYWNSEASYPIAVLSPESVNQDALERLRAKLAPVVEQARQSEYAKALQRDDAVRRFIEGDWPFTFTGDYHFVSDDPLKARRAPGRERSDVLSVLEPALRGTQRKLTIISPYFVPRQAGTAELKKLAERGRQVRILTNSLAANDVAAVHGGYAKYRKPLLASGVALWELKPLPGSATTSSIFGSRGASLHTKALAIDERQLFVGSYNLDPRSTSLNCEQGVLVANAELALQLEALFAEQTAPAHAWSVRLSDGELSWSDGEKTFDADPMASAMRRFQAWGASVLPVESQL